MSDYFHDVRFLTFSIMFFCHYSVLFAPNSNGGLAA
jgi:hypothetical protein